VDGGAGLREVLRELPAPTTVLCDVRTPLREAARLFGPQKGASSEDVAVLGAVQAPGDFHARFAARSRSYRYRVHTRRAPSPFEQRRALWWPKPLDRAALDACAAALAGTHDFTAFTPTATEHVRFARDVFRAEWVEEPGDVLAFWIEADTFMRHMVRVLVGTMLEGIAPERFAALLEGRPRSDAGATAPAHGLYLESVAYP